MFISEFRHFRMVFRSLRLCLAVKVLNNKMSVPNVKLNNGLTIPILGIGTWKSKPGEIAQGIKDAIDIGYRLIDCAYYYGNETEVGEAIAAKIADGTVRREDLFVTSKLWCTFHAPELVEGILKASLKNLGLDYLDLYLIHWPHAFKEGGKLLPFDADGKIEFSDVDYVDTWAALEKTVEAGLTKSIGISNFNARQIARLLENAKILPVTNQVECHPYLTQKKLKAVCESHNIVLTAYSPLGSPDRPWAKPDDVKLLDDPKLKEIADRLGKTVAQIIIRYQIDSGNVVIPKSVTKSRIAQNFDVFNFKLSEEDLKLIDSFDCNGRLVPMTISYAHKHHPFINDEF